MGRRAAPESFPPASLDERANLECRRPTSAGAPGRAACGTRLRNMWPSDPLPFEATFRIVARGVSTMSRSSSRGRLRRPCARLADDSADRMGCSAKAPSAHAGSNCWTSRLFASCPFSPQVLSTTD